MYPWDGRAIEEIKKFANERATYDVCLLKQIRGTCDCRGSFAAE